MAFEMAESNETFRPRRALKYSMSFSSAFAGALVVVGAEDSAGAEDEDTMDANALVAGDALDDTDVPKSEEGWDEDAPENENEDEGADAAGLEAAEGAPKEKGVVVVALDPKPLKPENFPGAGGALMYS